MDANLACEFDVEKPDPIGRGAALMHFAGDASRARILVILRDGELCVTDIIARLNAGRAAAGFASVSQPAVSHQLGMLRKAGLAEGTRDPANGRRILYSLTTTGVGMVNLIAGATAMNIPESRLTTRSPILLPCRPAGD